ncbi:MAG: YceI family protein [Acidimicrobiales bacterium]
MTDLETPSAADAARRAGRRRLLTLCAVLGLALIAFGAWWFVLRDTAPATVGSDAAEAARDEALGAATDPAASDETTAEGAEAEPGVDASAAAVADTEGVDGTWTVDTTIGTFDDACLTEVCDTTFVGFRIDEELAGIGAKTVVGRSPGVAGSMVIEGTTIVATELVADMTQLITDDANRTNAIRTQAIETAAFPEARFTLTEPIELGALPADGEEIDVDATGELTIHGVTRTETIPLTAERAGDVIVVFGQLGPILLADYDIDEPTAAVVLSVEDNAIMELQVFFRRG